MEASLLLDSFRRELPTRFANDFAIVVAFKVKKAKLIKEIVDCVKCKYAADNCVFIKLRFEHCFDNCLQLYNHCAHKAHGMRYALYWCCIKFT